MSDELNPHFAADPSNRCYDEKLSDGFSMLAQAEDDGDFDIGGMGDVGKTIDRIFKEASKSIIEELERRGVRRPPGPIFENTST
jgi:hypothetical protein